LPYSLQFRSEVFFKPVGSLFSNSLVLFWTKK